MNIQHAAEIPGPQLILKDLYSMGNLGLVSGMQDQRSSKWKRPHSADYGVHPPQEERLKDRTYLLLHYQTLTFTLSVFQHSLLS